MALKVFKRGITGVLPCRNGAAESILLVCAVVAGSLGPDSWDGGQLKGLFWESALKSGRCMPVTCRTAWVLVSSRPTGMGQLLCGSPKRDMPHMPMSVQIRVVCYERTEATRNFLGTRCEN